jgi:hypothetical protein
MGEGRNVFSLFMGKPKGKRLLQRPRRRLEDGIKKDIRGLIAVLSIGVDSAGLV